MDHLPEFATHFPAGYPTIPPRGVPLTENSTSRSDGLSSTPLEPGFDIFEWHPAYQSCQRFFLDHSQHQTAVQAVCALLNICLPFQWNQKPIMSASGPSPQSFGPAAYAQPRSRQASAMNSQSQPTLTWVSLIPYVRRLIVTGFDSAGVMLGFFGEHWKKGVGPLHEIERRNYLFTAKSGGWSKCKDQYDMSPCETVPFIRPLRNPHLLEIEAAEKMWSDWLAMEDWMIGPRTPHTDSLMPAVSSRGR